MSTSSPKPARIASLDQFRGYTVAGMFLVNFLGGFTACPEILKHKHIYVSYADTIMPHFLFAVGFAFRLTFGRRILSAGSMAAYRRVVTRFLGLVLVAIVVYGANRASGSWLGLEEMGAWGALHSPLKREWFQTLMHIALTALWITPVIKASARTRIMWMLGSAGLHIWLSHLFNFAWCSTSPNVIDGGPVGVLTWTVPAILGTLVCDAVADAEGRPNLFKMFAWSILVMGVGWLMTCGTRLYDLDRTQLEDLRDRIEAQNKEKGEIAGKMAPHNKVRGESTKRIRDIDELLNGSLSVEKEEDQPDRDQLEKEKAELEEKFLKAGVEIEKIKAKLAPPNFRELKLAADPVIPNAERFKGRDWEDWKSLIAEPPFVFPPHDQPGVGKKWMMKREWNYWMVSQRYGTLSYTTFCGGFSIFVYALFYIVCDIWGLKLGFFRTFGTNALFAYALHGMTDSAVSTFMPRDVPGWYMWTGFAVFMWLTWLFVRSLEKNKIFIKL